MSSVLRFLKGRELYYDAARYSLAALMMSFGMLKILGMQFNTVRPFATWAQPLEQLSGQQLTWAFMGHSTSFQVVMGLCEFIPAAMLLFRRTALLGALLLLPMTIGVFLVNFQMDLWTNTKMDAAYMLAANVTILLLDSKRLKSIIALTLTNGKPNVWEAVAAIVVITLAALPRVLSSHYSDDKNELTGDWFHEGPYAYELISETQKGMASPHRNTTIFFGPNGEYSEVNDSLSKSGSYKMYKVDEATRTLNISKEESGPWLGSYYVLSGSLVYALSANRLTISNNAGHQWFFVRRRVVRNKD